jgi:hypothetical protein
MLPRGVNRSVRSLPNARCVELTDAGHLTYAQQPDQLAIAVRAFASAQLMRNQSLSARGVLVPPTSDSTMTGRSALCRRYVPGDTPNSRLKAFENEASVS